MYFYEKIDCLYTFFKNRFHSSKVTSSREVFNQLSLTKKLVSTQAHGSVFLHRNRMVQHSKNESDLLKLFDCFIDCHASVHSAFVSFVIK